MPDARKKLIARYMARFAPTRFSFLAVPLPVIRKSFKNLQCQRAKLEDQFRVFDANWKSAKTFEQSLLSIFWLDSLSGEDLFKLRKKFLPWAKRIDNWAHADSFCSNLAKLYEMDAQAMEPIYLEWEKSPNPWMNRLSLVGLVYYSRFRKTHPSFRRLVSSIEKFFDHNHYYVQKAVGWTMRETYNVYPQESLSFILKNAGRFGPPGWFAVTEKLKSQDKLRANKARKQMKTR